MKTIARIGIGDRIVEVLADQHGDVWVKSKGDPDRDRTRNLLVTIKKGHDIVDSDGIRIVGEFEIDIEVEVEQ